MSKTRTITPNPPADFTPEMGDYMSLKPFRYWCQKVLPLVYDDSLSYYELLCKVVDYLNKTMEDVEVLHEDVDNLHTAYEQLQNYVNNYFSTLDVQKEINNKLDEMAQSGYLSSIIAPLVINVAVPIFVDNMGEMTDKGRIYVLTTTGYVYIWNGTNWYNTGMNYTDNFVNYMQVVDTLSNDTDANDITVNGFWNLSDGNTYKNLPITLGLFQVTNIKGVTYQIAVDGSKNNANYGQFWFRSCYGDPLVFGEWVSYDPHPNVMDAHTNYLATGTDLNNVVKTGSWNLSGGNEYINSPIRVGLLEVYNNGILYQRVTDMSTGSIGNVYMRWSLGGTLGDWYKIVNSDFIASNDLLVSADLNDMTMPGAWGLSGSYEYQNCPVTVGNLMVMNNAGVIYQIITDGSRAVSDWGATPKSGDRYFRAYFSDTWSSWSKISVDKVSFSDRQISEAGSIQYGEHDVTIKSFESGYYHNDTGILTSSDIFCRTKTLIKAKSRCGYRVHDSSILNTIYAIWFDADYGYIGFNNISNTDQLPTVAPSNAEYVGINFALADSSAEFPTNLVLDIVDSSDLLSLNNEIVESDKVLKIMNRVINNDGTLSSISDTFKCIFIANPKCTKVFANFGAVNQCYCINSAGENVTPTEYTDITPIGRVYEIPEDVVLMGINLYQNGGAYIALTYDESVMKTERCISGKTVSTPRLNGRKIMCIGDSLTYLDGRSIDNVDRFMGYQSYLRMSGAIVDSLGYSGRPYAQNSEGSNIADTVVDGAIDLSGYDTVILFGGSNDVRLSLPIGTANTDYNSKNIDSATFIGAVGKLINYCRTQNPNMEIFLSTITPSYDDSRAYSKIITYNDALKELGSFWNVPVIDTFQLVNWQPSGNLSTFCYDNTHPNQLGMNRIGRIFASYIDNYLSMVGYN